MANNNNNFLDLQDHLLKEFSGWHQPIGDILQKTPSKNIFKTDIYEMPKMKSWGDGKVRFFYFCLFCCLVVVATKTTNYNKPRGETTKKHLQKIFSKLMFTKCRKKNEIGKVGRQPIFTVVTFCCFSYYW